MKITTEKGFVGALLGNGRLRRLLLISTALVVALPASAAGRFAVRGGFGYGAGFGGWYYPYDPFFYGGYAMVHPNSGQLKLDTKVKDADVYINGAYAGTAGEVKNMWLHQGAYNLELRAPGRSGFSEKIYVVNGKTIHVHPDLRAEPKS